MERGGCIFIYSCSARLISFEINLKRNSSGITRIYEYIPPPPIEIINNTTRGIEAKIWERANGGQI